MNKPISINITLGNQLSGVLLLCMLVSVVMHLFVSGMPYWVLGVFSWLAALLLLPRLMTLQKIQAAS